MTRFALAIAVVLAGALALAATGVGTSPPPIDSRYELANRCFALASAAAEGEVRVADAGYAVGSGAADPARFFFEPTGLGTYMLFDDGQRLAGVGGQTEAVRRGEQPGRAAEWRVDVPRPDTLIARSTLNGRQLAVAGSQLVATDSPGRRGKFIPVPLADCPAFPEAHVDARGRPFRGTAPNGSVAGFADLHLHVTADDRAGGLVLYGDPFDRFGISEALGRDAEVHGSDGSMDVTGNLLRDELPVGSHDPHGWPTFAGWPTHDTNTHQQVYWRWLQRMWMAGERLVVAQVVEDESICEIEPRRSHSCDETEAVIEQVRKLRALERYVDAQAGGPGRGWFRLVRNPLAARRVIEDGKLAVVLGVESSNLFGCSEYEGAPQCDRADVDRGIRLYRRLGIRSVFVAHWTDNAFAGAALEGGAKGAFINVFNRWQTGHYIDTAPCPRPGQGEEPQTLSPVEMAVVAPFFPATLPLATEPPPEYPPGKQCNAKGLTRLGAYAIRRLIANRILIEADHLSERARARVLAITAKRGYPLVSSHTGTGGAWTEPELRRLYAAGGIAASTPADAPELAEKITGYRRYQPHGHHHGVPLGSDTGGFSSLPGPQDEIAPLRYPFRSHDGKVVFSRQRSGTRSFDLNTDGVAHYGLFADLLAAMEHTHGGHAAADSLFTSAEAYLRMWERAARISR